ncbi:MAG: GNAT family N-acetyltransferase [Prevotella sp.]|jgi:GNAT superfamily N-acetyltransferase
MDEEITFRKAVPADEQRSMQIIDEAKAQMRSEGRDQWNENYPTLNDIRNDIAEGLGIVATLNDKILAYGAVGFDCEPAYEHIKGNWLTTKPYIVVHRLAVADEAKGHGVASKFIEEVERIAEEKGVESFKVDTNFDNASMLHILKKLGFTYCGDIFFEGGNRMAFEKILHPNKV